MAEGWRKNPVEAVTIRLSVMLTVKEHSELVKLSVDTKQSMSNLCRVALKEQYGFNA